MKKKLTTILFILLLTISLTNLPKATAQPEENIAGDADIILVRNDDPIDQIIVRPYSSIGRVPIISTTPDSLSQSAKTQLEAHKEFGANNVLIVGSDEAISPEIETSLEDLEYNVERIGGWFRYETASRFAVEYWNNERVSRAFIAKGQDYGAASVAAEFASSWGAPLLLSKQDSVTDYTLTALQRLSVDRVLLVGGSLDQSVRDELIRNGYEVARIGEDIPASELIDQAKHEEIYNLISKQTLKIWDTSSTVYLGNGESKELAKAGTRIAGMDGYPILLTRKDELPDETRLTLEELRTDQVVVLDPNIQEEVLNEIESLGYEVSEISPDKNATQILEDRTSGGIDFKDIGIALISILIGVVGAIVYGKNKWGRSRVPFEVLTEKEQKIVKSLQEHNGIMKQELLPEETNYSRPTISRILTELEKKGIIEKDKSGKTYKVKLIKELERK